jgi:hypothetical protein
MPVIFKVGLQPANKNAVMGSSRDKMKWLFVGKFKIILLFLG